MRVAFLGSGNEIFDHLTSTLRLSGHIINTYGAWGDLSDAVSVRRWLRKTKENRGEFPELLINLTGMEDGGVDPLHFITIADCARRIGVPVLTVVKADDVFLRTTYGHAKSEVAIESAFRAVMTMELANTVTPTLNLICPSVADEPIGRETITDSETAASNILQVLEFGVDGVFALVGNYMILPGVTLGREEKRPTTGNLVLDGIAWPTVFGRVLVAERAGELVTG